jgi:hypothetical protein
MALSPEIGKHIAGLGSEQAIQNRISNFLKEAPPYSVLDASGVKKEPSKAEHIKENFDSFVSKLVETELTKKKAVAPVLPPRPLGLNLRAGVISLLHVKTR